MFQYELNFYRSSTSSGNFSAGSIVSPTASNSTTATAKYDSAAAASTNDAYPTINGITHDNAFSLSTTGTFALPGTNNV